MQSEIKPRWRSPERMAGFKISYVAYLCCPIYRRREFLADGNAASKHKSV